MPAAPADIGSDPPPPVLPVFPLTGLLLLPGNLMPLNIFEPRYRSMVEDVLADGGHIGMIQPLLPGPDNLGVGEDDPELYSVGCAGLLERAERQDDGRFLILLRGVMRFSVDAEIELRHGYRRVRASYGRFGEDLLTEPDRLAALPFAAAEQQALLEATTVADRLCLLLELMRMDETSAGEAPSFVPPTVN